MIINQLCYCGKPWNSILPPPPCPYHSVQVHNGLCTCRGWHNPHPFHRESITSAGQLQTDYVGKHRAPETP